MKKKEIWSVLVYLTELLVPLLLSLCTLWLINVPSPQLRETTTKKPQSLQDCGLKFPRHAVALSF